MALTRSRCNSGPAIRAISLQTKAFAINRRGCLCNGSSPEPRSEEVLCCQLVPAIQPAQPATGRSQSHECESEPGAVHHIRWQERGTVLVDSPSPRFGIPARIPEPHDRLTRQLPQHRWFRTPPNWLCRGDHTSPRKWGWHDSSDRPCGWTTPVASHVPCSASPDDRSRDAT